MAPKATSSATAPGLRAVLVGLRATASARVTHGHSATV